MKKIFARPLLFYLRILAKVQIRKINPTIIGIGGASGKSSLAHITYKILSTKYKVKQSGGKNSETGIPLSILDIEPKNYSLSAWFKASLTAPFQLITNWKKYDYYIAEMGIDNPSPPKNMEYLLRIIQPKIGVLTNILPEHSVYFDSLVKNENDSERKKEILDLTAKQEGMLLKSISQDGRAIINLDNPYIKDLLPLRAKTISVSSKEKKADFYIVSSKITGNLFSIKFEFLNEIYTIEVPQPLPKYYAKTITMALAIAFSCGISIRDAVTELSENFSLPAGRFSVFGGIKNSLILDSSYNSSLEPAVGCLDALSEIAGERRKLAILGDMRELGSLSRIQHESLAREILKTSDFAIIIGPSMKEFVAPILEKGNFNFLAFDTFRQAKESILGNVKTEDVVLVKGSQNTLFLERAIEILLADKKDRDRLCRRGDFWDKMRKVTP